jgi:sulfonate transport system ATP-binding protein
MAHALRITGLAKSYRGRPVLGPIDLELAPETITAVIGRSGSGKTTLLRCLGALERPSAGSIHIGTGDLAREEIGYVFQEPRLMPWLTVAGNVAFGLAHADPGRRASAVAEALQVVGLSAAGQLLPKQLSGGMAQRVALARALAPAPGVLLLDEPFSALDPFTREQMQLHLLHLHRHYRTTMVLITHDMDEALALADRIIVLRGPPGRVVADLTPCLPKACARTSADFVGWRARLTDSLAEPSDQDSANGGTVSEPGEPNRDEHANLRAAGGVMAAGHA